MRDSQIASGFLTMIALALFLSMVFVFAAVVMTR